MIDIGTYEDFLKTLEKTLSEQKNEIEKLILQSPEGEEKEKLKQVNSLSLELETALKNKDIDSMNKILSNANNINK